MVDFTDPRAIGPEFAAKVSELARVVGELVADAPVTFEYAGDIIERIEYEGDYRTEVHECSACGALVRYPAQDKHRDFHGAAR
jgi:hypothetical protein